MTTINIIGPKFESRDRDLFHDDDVLTPLTEEDKSLAHLLFRLGKFTSIGEAKRNGWDKPIPTGWKEFTIGKNQNLWKIFIWNPELTLQEFITLHGDD